MPPLSPHWDAPLSFCLRDWPVSGLCTFGTRLSAGILQSVIRTQSLPDTGA